MKLRNNILAAIAAAIISLPFVAGNLHATPQSDDYESPDFYGLFNSNAEQSALDSIEAARTDSLLTLSRSLIDRVQAIKTAVPLDYDEYFPAAYEAAQVAMEVLPRLTKRSSDWNDTRMALIDLDADLEAGAYYYSSEGNQSLLNRYAQAYLDIQLLDAMKDLPFKRDPNPFSQMAYIAASGAYNDQNYDKAIDYFQLYFSAGGAPELREKVYLYLGQAAYNAKRYDLAITTMAEGIKLYPYNQYMPTIGIQSCIDGGEADYLQDFLNEALKHKPDDKNLLTVQGMLYEDELEYKRALDIYNRLDLQNPGMLENAKHIALCYYNIAVDYYNKAINESNEKIATKNRRQAKTYFAAAAEKLEDVVASDPMAVRYLRALGVSYLCLEDKNKFDGVNNRLTALHQDPLGNVFMPPLMSYNENRALNYQRRLGSKTLYNDDTAPLYSEYGEKYIKEKLEKWVPKGEFETIDSYKARVNESTIVDEYRRLSLEAQQSYLDRYSNSLRLSDITLEPYDANNETFLINTCYGPVTVNVPMKDNEAMNFKSNWEGMRFREPKYIIDNDNVLISGLTITAPYGKSYTYDSGRQLAYAQTIINLDLNAILADFGSNQNTGVTATRTRNADVTITRKSDVDVNIPINRKPQPNTFALIIANENYENAENVQSALHDGEIFAQYCEMTLGIPSTNINILRNATYGKLAGALSNLSSTVRAVGRDAEVIVYYAGHGMPDENTRDAYLLPTDGVPAMPSTSFPLSKLYADLENMDAKSVMVFMDACFSGAGRSGDMLQSARGVVIRPKETAPRGSMFVLTAASGQETALPYTEKNHGLFTYYLLKKLQESKGNVTLKDLSDYVIQNVSRQSNVINKKSQTPTVSTSGAMSQQYNSKKMRP